MTLDSLAGAALPVPVPVPVPEAAQVRDLLQALTGAQVEARPARPVLPGPDTAVVAVYVTDQMVPGAVLACELSLAASAGAALGAVSPAEVERSLAAGALTLELAENVAEVLNVLVSVFHTTGAPAMTLHHVHAAGEPLPDDIGSVLRYVMRRTDLHVDVVGYGGGRLSVIAVA